VAAFGVRLCFPVAGSSAFAAALCEERGSGFGSPGVEGVLYVHSFFNHLIRTDADGDVNSHVYISYVNYKILFM
jgi:hypothetical protein